MKKFLKIIRYVPVIIFTCVVLAIVAYYIHGAIVKKVAPDPEQKLRLEAWEEAKEHVIDRLKSPSTAVFPELPDKDDLSHVRDRNIPWISNPAMSLEEEDHHYSLELLRRPRDEQQREYERLTGTDKAKKRFRVRGWVDAQNVYGAVIRNRFVLTLIHDGSSYKYWALEGIRFEEN